MQDLLQTTRTYKTRANAVAHLERCVKQAGIDPSEIRYFISVNEEGRFAPVVTGGERHYYLCFLGVTISA